MSWYLASPMRDSHVDIFGILYRLGLNFRTAFLFKTVAKRINVAFLRRMNIQLRLDF